MSEDKQTKPDTSDTEVKVDIEKKQASRQDTQPPPVEATETVDTTEGVEAGKEPTEVERLGAQLEELEDRLLRTAAEFDNYKKRMARQFEEVIRSANDRLLVELLDVVDNFERALQHGNQEKTDLRAYRQGTELIFEQLQGLLEKYNVRSIDALGMPFDPNLHEAMMQVESDEYPQGTVAVEMSKGYVQGDRVLRHARVGVSKGKAQSADEDEGNENVSQE